MKKVNVIVLLSLLVFSCEKKSESPIQIIENCNIQKVRDFNAAKVTITNGIWGTVSSMEGNCMPVVYPSVSNCKHCAVKRTVKIYQLTNQNQATVSDNPQFYENFTTQLITSVEADENGFYQAELPAGNYTVVVVENGKLYVSYLDCATVCNLNPVAITGPGKVKNDIVMTYKASF